MAERRPAFWAGFRAGLPFNLVIVPFGLLFGVVAVDAGLSLLEAMAMTSLVIAGASQFIAVQLLSDGAPWWLATITGLAVNLRMVMYSASMAPHVGANPLGLRVVMAYFLVDQSYGVAVARFEQAPRLAPDVAAAYFFGAAASIFPAWYGASYTGAVLGAEIPPALALDFAVPITFIALFAPSLRSAAHIAAAVAAVAASLALAGLPFGLGVLVAGFIGMGVGAWVEMATARP